MTAPRHAATGFIPGRSRKQEIRPRGAIPRTPRVWAYILDGAGPGLRTGAYFTIARRATWTENPGIPRENKFAGTRALKNGWAKMCRTSKPTPSPKITWARASCIRKAWAQYVRASQP